MITFILSILLLIVGYFTYGKFVERVFVADRKRQTPAFSMRDNIDYVPMNTTRNSLIQLLNIAGVGPIFGPILGALYGPVAFVWIVIGCIFAGAVHDYLTGMISIRNHGAHLPQLAGKFLGKAMKHVVNGFAILLLLLVGTVFVTSPAALLANMTSFSVTLIILAIFAYYLVATLLPIDSEHSAIFQCLPEDASQWARRIDRIMLTSSGGPFRQTPLADLPAMTPSQACAHPNFAMGRKISVDSATMMNKALEVIEAYLGAGTTEALRAYVASFPAGAHVAEARTRISATLSPPSTRSFSKVMSAPISLSVGTSSGGMTPPTIRSTNSETCANGTFPGVATAMPSAMARASR